MTPLLVPTKIVTAVNGRLSFLFAKLPSMKVVSCLGVFYHSKWKKRDCKTSITIYGEENTQVCVRSEEEKKRILESCHGEQLGVTLGGICSRFHWRNMVEEIPLPCFSLSCFVGEKFNVYTCAHSRLSVCSLYSCAYNDLLCMLYITLYINFLIHWIGLQHTTRMAK